MDFINDLSTDSVFELIKQYYRDEQGKEIQIGSDEFAMASMMAYVCRNSMHKRGNAIWRRPQASI